MKTTPTNASLKVKIILGSTRPGRFGDKPAAWIVELAKRQGAFEVELLDLWDWKLPFYNEDHSLSMKPGVYADPVGAKWAAKIAEADAYIVISPEYNHGPSAVVKNALDYAYTEWNHKPIAFISYGSVGGARAVEQLRGVAVELQMAPIRGAVHIMAPWMLTDEKGTLKPGALDPYADAATGMLSQLAWWAEALAKARKGKS
jgi:NAD(P)H-dependent FMN reductase